jgi:uncharacterized protein related to proFAR isomerase
MQVKDKQAFMEKDGMMRLLGKPIDVAKRWKDEGCQLIHILDADAIKGTPTNLDIYSNMTYFINVQVECAPVKTILTKLLRLKCRVVLRPTEGASIAAMAEKKLLVALVRSGERPDKEELAPFHDVILEDADDESVSRCLSFKKRVIIYEKDEKKLKKTKDKVWGVISTS